MQKQVIVLSLGGSLIIPDEIDVQFLKKFKETLKKHTRKYKFIIVTGGGSVARKYITALRELGLNNELQSMSGISATRMNARFMTHFFDHDPKEGIPHTAKALEKELKKQDIVFCGALEYKPKQTSDATAAELASKYKTAFINLTNVPGLHDKNPLEHLNAKFIHEISWKDFLKMANARKYEPGQHFVLDQTAAEIILKKKIPTFIIGKDLAQLDNLLSGKSFKGTIIKG